MILLLFYPPFDIGAHRKGCNDGNGKWQKDHPFVILREVTQADWIEYCRAECGPDYPLQWQIRDSHNQRFFEVATD